MEYPKEIFVKDYFEIHNYYANIYGKKRTIILMQVGSFHECYSTDVDGLNIVDLAQEINVHCTKKNGNLPVSKSNPRMIGFPVHVTYNYIDKLIDMDYTVVLIDQFIDNNSTVPTRKVTNIFSPATYLNKSDTKHKYLVSLVIEKIKQLSGISLCLGVSCYDLSTGDGAFFETYSKVDDMLIGLDDITRFLEKYPPREILLEHNIKDDDVIGTMCFQDILLYLSIDIKTVYTTTITYQRKTTYQKELLDKTFNTNNVIEMLDLQYINTSRLSLVLLLEYIIAHQPSLLNNIQLPKVYTTSHYLYLGNRANNQLNVMPKKKDEKSLFDIINFTKTQLGKRFLHCQLTLPLTNIDELNKRYEMIDILIKGNHANKLSLYLEDIYDIDKLVRKLQMNIIQPNELHNIYISIYQIIKLIEYLENNKLMKVFDIKIKDKMNLINIIEYINKIFILEKLSDATQSFYKKNIYPEIDKLELDIMSNQNFIDNLVISLENIMESDVIFKKQTDERKSLITVKYNDKDGHYLLITNKRCSLLKKKLDTMEKITIGTIELKISDFEFNPLPKTTSTKVTCNKMNQISTTLTTYKALLCKLLKDQFKQDIQNIYNNFGNYLCGLSNMIGFIDFINSGALCSISNHYTRPIIKKMEHSYFIGNEMRHPIIENISTDCNYIPHNIELGTNTKQNGLLLYGINSSGKSTLMKSIGLNIILAQIGYYTATSYFEYYPYNNLMTRICGNDNMFKGQSSFMVEMMELMTILKRNSCNTLVIADEICRGTEEKSANIIVCYMLEKLSNNNTSFITATHLHRLASLQSVVKLDRVKAKHLKITYNSSQDKIIYDRHLTDGQGETFYGLQVAKYLMKDVHFNKRTSEILDEYDNIKIKKSSYNSDVLMTNCYICKATDNLETHHIIWQKDFDENGYHQNKYHLRKNDKSNLLVLCLTCHDKVDRKEIVIDGWNNTTNGRELIYTTQPKKKQSKYTFELINYINSMKGTIDITSMRIKVKETFGKKISTNSIKQLWSE
jgi:DNA mismatch repair protein MutS